MKAKVGFTGNLLLRNTKFKGRHKHSYINIVDDTHIHIYLQYPTYSENKGKEQKFINIIIVLYLDINHVAQWFIKFFYDHGI